MISSPYPYEPHKFFTAVQAAVILLLAVVPLIWSVSFRTVVSDEPLQVTIVSEVPRPVPPAPAAELNELSEQIEQLQAQEQRQAELARRRAKEREAAEAERRRQEEAQQRQREQQERERQQQLEEQRQREQEQKRQQEQQQERERQQLEAQRQQEQQRQLEQQRLEQQRNARLEAQRNEQIMARYISEIHNRIQRYMADPEGVAPNIRAEIYVPLDSNGRLAGEPTITASSGNELFDQQALRAVIRGAENGFPLPDDPKLRSQFAELYLVLVPRGSL